MYKSYCMNYIRIELASVTCFVRYVGRRRFQRQNIQTVGELWKEKKKHKSYDRFSIRKIYHWKKDNSDFSIIQNCVASKK